MVLRFLGESVTDSNGLAVLSDGYTGTGAGLVDIIAETVIDESTIVSNSYEVLDSIIYIKGDTVTSNLTTNASINLSVDDGFIKMTPSASNKWQALNVNSSSNYLSPSNNYRAEFDYIIPTTDYALFTICGANIRINWGTATEEHHAKVELIDGVAKIYIDGSTTASGTGNVGTATDCAFGLYSLSYLKIKNFQIYPI